MVSKRTKVELDQLKYFIDDGIDIKNRIIMINDEIDNYNASSYIRAMWQMFRDDNKAPIHVWINSPGGEAYAGLAVYDTIIEISELGTEVVTRGTGMVMSVAFVIYLAGDRRCATENCTFMMHEVSGGAIGKSFELKNEAKECERLTKICVELIANRTGYKDTKWWNKFIKYEDRMMDISKALELGVLCEED